MSPDRLRFYVRACYLPDALDTLSHVEPSDEMREKVIRAISPLLADRSHFTRNAAISALATWDPKRVAPMLAGMLASFFDNEEAQKQLIRIGPAAEEVVIPYLTHPDAKVRHRACFVLAQIGTEKSLEGLRKLRRDRAMGLSARQAAEMIRQRQSATGADSSKKNGSDEHATTAPEE